MPIPSIYKLVDPCDGTTRYIGKANNPEKRLKGHILAAVKKNYPVSRWIRRLLAAGLIPKMEVIEVCTTRDWQTAEKEHIAEAIKRGDKILNVTCGGDELPANIDAIRSRARKLAKSVHSDPERKRIWGLKREMGHLIKLGYVKESTKEKLREAARRCPQLFACFATI